jgi:NADH-quinone oxidoreductase subunit G
VTSVTGEVQKLKAAAKVMGTKPDLEIFRLIAKEMGLPMAAAGAAAQVASGEWRVASIQSSRDTLFTSGTLGRYSKALQAVMEGPGELYRGQ